MVQVDHGPNILSRTKMARIVVTQDLTAPVESVWPKLADLESHSEWMKDAESIVFRSTSRRGVGVEMEVETRVGPLRTLDIMEVTGWEEGKSISVRHKGLVTGEGTLSLRPRGNTATTIVWDEQLTFPWWLGGRVIAWIAKPVLKAIWRGNLRRFAEGFSSP